MPRAVALDLLDSVLAKKRPLDEALDTHPRLNKLEARDRAFARLLTATTLRRLGQIDDLLNQCLEKPLTGKAKPVLDLLRLGVCQLIFLKTPPHAAVSTSVDLAEGRRLVPYKKLINAVLRRISRDGQAMIADQDAAQLTTPDWLWQSWTQAYGEATCRAIAEAHLTEAPLDLSTKGDPEPWANQLGATLMPTGSLRFAEGRGSVQDLPGYEEGAWWVQDAAAALPARLLGDVRGLKVFDLCAAPGGKTAQLAAAGAEVTAVDRSPKRLERLTENLKRLGLSAVTIAADAADWQPDGVADAVLVDAPCSATGTIRRHPDIPRLKGPDDVASLSTLQGHLLRAAIKMVRPGGTIVYCVCSLQPEEGPMIVRQIIDSGAPVEAFPITAAEIGGLDQAIDRKGQVRTLPCHLPGEGGLDGFFIARLRRL